MSSASLALQKSVVAALAGNTALLALLGGPSIHDGAPQGTPHPYVTVGQTRVIDWSTGTEPGDEHLLTLHAWSKQPGKSQVHAILSAIRTALHEAALVLDGHRLISLRHQFSEARRAADGETWHGLVRFRALTEPL